MAADGSAPAPFGSGVGVIDSLRWSPDGHTLAFLSNRSNPRGSDEQGLAYARAVGSAWGGMDYQDILDGLDLLVARGIADPARLGIGGWSSGGFMAAWAITHGDRFKAAVAGAAPSDLAAFSNMTDTPDFPAGYFGPAADHLALLDAHSSARLLKDASAPSLVLHGAEDTRVLPTLGLEL